MYRVLTPDECVTSGGDHLVPHPLCGGLPVAEGWRGPRLFRDGVLPRTSG
ncbi:hypothetical protein [Streptomyces sp. NPDC006997]